MSDASVTWLRSGRRARIRIEGPDGVVFAERDPEWGEWCVNPEGAEDTKAAYYTDDEHDAIGTGCHMVGADAP